MKESARFYALTAYVTLLVAALAGAGKLATVGPLTVSATIFAYAVAALIIDGVHEVYGAAEARRFVLAGFFGVGLALLCFQVVVALPAADAATGAEHAYALVLGTTPRLFAAGMLAYLVSQLLDVWVFARLRELTHGRHLWLRNLGSTLLSQLVDTVIFIGAAFWGIAAGLPELVAGQFTVKAALTLTHTPALYAVLWIVRRALPELRRRAAGGVYVGARAVVDVEA